MSPRAVIAHRRDVLTLRDLLYELFGEDGYEVHAHADLLDRALVLQVPKAIAGEVFARSFQLGDADIELGA